MLSWCNAIFTNSKYWFLFSMTQHMNQIQKRKWSIPFLFLLSCAVVTMEINCANSTQPSNLQCLLGLSLIIFHYYSINCMDIYEVHVFTAWRTWISDWNATKSGKVRLALKNRVYLKIRLKLRMSLSLNHSPWHGLKKSHRHGWQFQLIKGKKTFPSLNYTNMQYRECPEICAQTSHIHLMNTVIKMSFDKSFTSA
jgi:hypothetical protein